MGSERGETSGPTETDDARELADRGTPEDFGERRARYRSALGAGTAPTLVAQWMAEVQGEGLRGQLGVGGGT